MPTGSAVAAWRASAAFKRARCLSISTTSASYVPNRRFRQIARKGQAFADELVHAGKCGGFLRLELRDLLCNGHAFLLGVGVWVLPLVMPLLR